MAQSSTRQYAFGPYLLIPQDRLLQCNGEAVHLTPKAFEVLTILVENSGRLVEKGELLRRVWPNTFVEEGSLSVNISLLRKTLGERRGGPKYIENVTGYGYRFVAAVRKIEGADRSSHYTRSIAVLPFKVIGGSPGDDYLGLGITDLLITKISQIRQIIVRPTNAVLRYSNAAHDPLAAGRELYVDTVLDGRIQRAGEQVRVTVQLLNVQDGSLLWAEKMDENFTNIFACEDSIAERVAQALLLTSVSNEARQPIRHYTDNADAYQFYLKGRYHWNKRSFDGFTKAIAYFEKAIKADTAFALAYAGLADTYILLNTLPPEAVMPKAKAAAVKALELDEALAEAHSSLAFVLENYEWNWKEAEREYKRAIELNPNYATVRQWYAEHLAAMGQHEEAIAEIYRAHMLDPLSLSISNSVARQFYFARQYDRAIEQCLHTLEMAPDFIPAHYRLGGIYVQAGMYEEAIASFKKALELSGGALVMLTELGYAYAMAGQTAQAQRILDDLNRLSETNYVGPDYLAQIHLGMGRHEEVFDWLERTCEARLPLMIYLKVDPIFDSIRSAPRFQKLLQRTGLAAAPGR